MRLRRSKWSPEPTVKNELVPSKFIYTDAYEEYHGLREKQMKKFKQRKLLQIIKISKPLYLGYIMRGSKY